MATPIKDNTGKELLKHRDGDYFHLATTSNSRREERERGGGGRGGESESVSQGRICSDS